eukprot:TRINITY_DN1612_c0_g1_i14.p2 TRINITY_DN1612_c0_g1~~TRINITY_DN1612_c0_g1_i14.p2  ORF type:complete len:236 (-),score=-27.99 TRINITY_DN1612_c0_g1_i14:819-1526(-)
MLIVRIVSNFFYVILFVLILLNVKKIAVIVISSIFLSYFFLSQCFSEVQGPTLQTFLVQKICQIQINQSVQNTLNGVKIYVNLYIQFVIKYVNLQEPLSFFIFQRYGFGQYQFLKSNYNISKQKYSLVSKHITYQGYLALVILDDIILILKRTQQNSIILVLFTCVIQFDSNTGKYFVYFCVIHNFFEKVLYLIIYWVILLLTIQVRFLCWFIYGKQQIQTLFIFYNDLFVIIFV